MKVFLEEVKEVGVQAEISIMGLEQVES